MIVERFLKLAIRIGSRFGLLGLRAAGILIVAGRGCVVVGDASDKIQLC